MNWLTSFSHWLTGGAHQYHTLRQCMMNDSFWIWVTVTLDVAVAAGYGVIAYHWLKNQRTVPPSPARRALGTMRNIFAFCGICGYLFIPVKLYWPAWRLYDLVMVGLVFYTWRYALNIKDLKVIYRAIGRSDKLESDLAQSKSELRRKSLFLNSISHDLRTPLNGLTLHADLAEIQVDSGDSAAVKASLEHIKSSAALTSKLLNVLLDYARLDGISDYDNNCEFNLTELISETVGASKASAAQKGLTLLYRESIKVNIHTDRLKLERILNNLLGNAIKFTTDGSVRVEVATARQDVEIHVIDTGIGIDPSHKDHLFEEFFQIHNRERDQQKGFGLGLSISRQLARQLGGDIHVESSPGDGSRFSVVLPGVIRTKSTEPVPGKNAGKLIPAGA